VESTTDLTMTTLGLSVCVSVTLVHPAKGVIQNEIPFGRDTCVVPSNIILDSGPRKGTF